MQRSAKLALSLISLAIILVVPASHASQTFDFSLSNSGNIVANQGGSGLTSITATLLSGTPQPVVLACLSGLPTGATCDFNPQGGSPTFTSTLTITVEPSTAVGSYQVTVTGTAGGLSHSTSVGLTVNPASTVGGMTVSIDKLAILSPYIGVGFGAIALVSVVALVATRRTRSGKESSE